MKGAKEGYAYATAHDAAQLNDLVEISNGKVVALSFDITNKDEIAKLGSLHPDVNLIINNAGNLEWYPVLTVRLPRLL